MIRWPSVWRGRLRDMGASMCCYARCLLALLEGFIDIYQRCNPGSRDNWCARCPSSGLIVRNDAPRRACDGLDYYLIYMESNTQRNGVICPPANPEGRDAYAALKRTRQLSLLKIVHSVTPIHHHGMFVFSNARPLMLIHLS